MTVRLTQLFLFLTEHFFVTTLICYKAEKNNMQSREGQHLNDSTQVKIKELAKQERVYIFF